MAAWMLAVALAAIAAQAAGSPQSARVPTAARPATGAPPPPPVEPPPGYEIGPEDVLSVLFWREPDMSVEQVTVRPDGKITLPLLNEVQAAGLTPEQLRAELQSAAERYVQDPNATVVVRQINSRKVFITGQVTRPGVYPLAGPMTVLQLIATAGGLLEYAADNNITVLRLEDGRAATYRFNYRDVTRR
jgi:polysaccharide export outer membrane protein